MKKSLNIAPKERIIGIENENITIETFGNEWNEIEINEIKITDIKITETA